MAKMGGGGCELCGKVARMFCESDEAVLCWDCDEKVHSANFLVAKHTRVLLCHACRGRTPWKASGSRLGPTVSVCHSCSCGDSNDPVEEEMEEEESGSRVAAEESYSDEFGSDDDDDEEEEDEEGEGSDEEEEEGENQVVPWSPARAAPPPPVASSSSSEGEEGGVWARDGLKRVRDDSDLDDSEDETGSSSCQLGSGGGGPGRLIHEEGNALASSFTRPLSKQPRTRGGEEEKESVHQHHLRRDGSSRSTAAILDSIKRLQRETVTNSRETASATIQRIRRMTRD